MEIKFKDYKYKRPDIELMKKEFDVLLNEFNAAKSGEDQYDILLKLNKLRACFDTMKALCMIRYTINTRDKFYSDENDFFDEVSPEYMSILNRLKTSVVNTKHREQLEKLTGAYLFNLYEVNLKTFSPEIIEDLKIENKLITEYIKLLATAKIYFEGEERNLAGLAPFMESGNRAVRKSAFEAKWKFFEDNESEFDRIYDELVKVRTRIANKLGYRNFVELGYDRMRRMDYSWKEVESFRKNVKEFIVPVSQKLHELKKKRLGIPETYYYDSDYLFKDGNPNPKGDPEWITSRAGKMYDELSEETSKFFNLMTERELMDLENKNGKSGGGYCSYIPYYESPFIFSNMNGTEHDIRVLTHEAGHAFQKYESREFEIPEYQSPTLESAEIHSMSMEFITYPWMNLFFEEDTDKFFYSHLSGRISFIPYGVTVDEFQHKVYENPEATPEERKKFWRETEMKYIPQKNYGENNFLNRGGFWFHQKHIFSSPFYYIDYCLAQICALQFWRKCNHDRDIAWNDYLRLCKAGGSKPFLELLKVAKVDSPFDKNAVKSIVNYSDELLESMNKVFDL